MTRKELADMMWDKVWRVVDDTWVEYGEKEGIELSPLPNSMIAEISGLIDKTADKAADILEWQENNAKRTHYYPVYSAEAEMTFILKRVYKGTQLLSEAVSGYYYGEPDDAMTEEYKENGTSASFEEVAK